ncbi:MAG: asparagine synthase B [Solobacterium sp.]|jgi:asparagine synthase (glutamine-hydrolysing)|nr:asparagine synthase B [Solobacterium sp.]MCH4265389.1 asparagine synthase B [Solobacterium sp.]
MCGILVSTDRDTDRRAFEEGLSLLQDRGPDMGRIETAGGCLMGFQRLSIMGLSEEGMQPFHLHGSYAVCNGELYGFRKMKELLKKTYAFQSESDCEILLPMYEQYGLKMFEMLDAEYAAVLYDAKKNSWIASRDPFGIRPLFYGYTAHGKICFGSTAASLMPIASDIQPFPTGSYYCDGTFTAYTHLDRPESVCMDSMEEITRKIHDLLTEGVLKRMDADAPVGYLLSGGLDSSLVCAIAQAHSKKPIRTFSVGMDVDAIDLKYARRAAEYIGSDHTEIIITKQDVIQALRPVIKSLESWDITTIRASIGMYLLCKAIHERTDIKVLFTGEISDELFGYKYTDYAPDAQSFQLEAQKRVRELYQYDVLRADRCISSNSMEGRVPFGDLAFARYVMSIDPEKKMNRYHMGKYLLRHAFENDRILPGSILFRDKAAFSDAVGHSLVDDLKAYAETQYSDAEFKSGCEKYEWSAPYTKESLLYRDIFESYYPHMDDLISGYWLPNQSWKGCQVTDPSARYLANYGASAI